MNGSALVEHFFRHEYGRLVAVLARRFGVRHFELIEDAAQGALLRALESWAASGPPEYPSAWVYRVAENALLGELRKGAVRERFGVLGAELAEESSGPPPDVPRERSAKRHAAPALARLSGHNPG